MKTKKKKKEKTTSFHEATILSIYNQSLQSMIGLGFMT
jgi:hypothetical protein